MNVFKLVYPEYWVQEISKIVKFFCMSPDGEESNLDWKDFFFKSFKDQVQAVYIQTGVEGMASDYKLLKNPFIQHLLPLKVVCVEFNNAE